MEGRRIAKGEAFRYMGVGMMRTSELFSVRMLGFGFFWAWLFLVAVPRCSCFAYFASVASFEPRHQPPFSLYHSMVEASPFAKSV